MDQDKVIKALVNPTTVTATTAAALGAYTGQGLKSGPHATTVAQVASAMGAAAATGAGVSGTAAAGAAVVTAKVAAAAAVATAAAPFVVGAAVIGGGIWGVWKLVEWLDEQ